MPRKKTYNASLPKPPGLDLSDKKTLAGARGVATKKNNAFRKLVETKLPLFREELYADFEPFTPEKVIEDRKIIREGWNERRREMAAETRANIRCFRSEIRARVSDNEFWRIFRQVATGKFSTRFMRWYCAYKKILDREKPLSESAALVLAWLEVENEPVSHHRLWQKRGDGMSKKEILDAFGELSDRDLVKLVDSSREIVDGIPLYVARWQTTKARNL